MASLVMLCLGGIPAGAQPARRLPIPKALGGFVLPAPPEPEAGIPAPFPDSVQSPAADRYVVDPDLSRFRFALETKIGHLAGTFERYQAEASVDRESGRLTGVKVTLDMDSIAVDSKRIPHFLIRAFLKTKEFPTSTVLSLAVRPGSSGSEWIDVEVVSRGERYHETIEVKAEHEGADLALTGIVHYTTPKGNKGVLDFDLLLKKAP